MWLLQVILTIPIGIIEIMMGFLSKIKENTKQNKKNNRKNNTKNTMKIFNAIQIVTALATSPIWLGLLHAASFTGAGALFWFGCAVVAVFFIWAIIGVTSTME